MSRNIHEHHTDKQVVTELAELQRTESQLHTTQSQGSEAIRLAVVEGYIKHTMLLGDPEYLYSEFVDIEAPDGATILIGSLVHTNFRVVYAPGFPGDPVDITPMDTDNTGFGGWMYNVWMRASIGSNDPGYTTVNSLGQLSSNAVSQNKIRIGSRVYLRQGISTTDTFEVWVLYQVRMTIGWQ